MRGNKAFSPSVVIRLQRFHQTTKGTRPVHEILRMIYRQLEEDRNSGPYRNGIAICGVALWLYVHIQSFICKPNLRILAFPV